MESNLEVIEDREERTGIAVYNSRCSELADARRSCAIEFIPARNFAKQILFGIKSAFSGVPGAFCLGFGIYC
jgi:hypothetical protein